MNRVFKTKFSKWFLGIPVLLIALLYGYHQNVPADERLSSCFWKIGSFPVPFGDSPSFGAGERYQISSGTIFREGVAVGEIIKVEYRLVADDIVHVKNFETGVEGQYYAKGC